MICIECHTPLIGMTDRICSNCGLVYADNRITSDSHACEEMHRALLYYSMPRISSSPIIRSHVENRVSPKELRERRAWQMFRGFCATHELPPTLPHFLVHEYRIAVHKHRVIRNHAVFTATLLLKTLRELHFPILLHTVVDHFQANGSRVNTRLIIRCSITYNLHIPRMTYLHYLPGIMDRIRRDPKLQTHRRHYGISEAGYHAALAHAEMLAHIMLKRLTPKHPYAIACACAYGAIKTWARSHGVERLINVADVAATLNVNYFTIRDFWVKYVKPHTIKLQCLEHRSYNQNESK